MQAGSLSLPAAAVAEAARDLHGRRKHRAEPPYRHRDCCGPDAHRYPGCGPARLHLHDLARLSIPCRRRLQWQCHRDGARRLRLVRGDQRKLDHDHFRQWRERKGRRDLHVRRKQRAASRTGTVTVARQTHTVTQAAVPCTYTIAPAAQSLAAGASSGSVTVTAPAGCSWSAATSAATAVSVPRRWKLLNPVELSLFRKRPYTPLNRPPLLILPN